MINNSRQLFFIHLILFVGLFSFNGNAQQLPKADNSIHDRMYQLMQKSESVALPKEVTEHLNLINKNNPRKAKTIFAQTSVLKVLYNKALPKDDIIFFGKQLLMNHSQTMIPIHADIRKILNKL